LNVKREHKKTPNQGRGLIQGGGEALTKAIKLNGWIRIIHKTLTEAKYSIMQYPSQGGIGMYTKNI